mgnify:CR=1 FL=1
MVVRLYLEEFPFESQVSLTLVDEKTIKEINKETRDIDKITDVLSFPMLELPAPSDFSNVEEDDGNFDYETEQGCSVLIESDSYFSN